LVIRISSLVIAIAIAPTRGIGRSPRVQIGPDCVVDRREIVAGTGIRTKPRPAWRDQPETGISGADITDQPSRDHRLVPGPGHYHAVPIASTDVVEIGRERRVVTGRVR
jgi:hypothetical protein